MRKLFPLAALGLASAFLAQPAAAQSAPDFQCGPTLPSAEIPYASRYIDVDGAKMHYYESGPSDGPVVLLLHGLPVSAYFWRNVIPHLDDNTRVIAMDHIGFGKSDRPEGLVYDTDDHVAYLDGFIREMGLNDIIMVGQDLGSWTGMVWASHNPEKLRAVALVEGIIPPVLPVVSATADPNLLGMWQAARVPEMAQKMFVDDNMFLNMVLPQFTACGLSEEALAVYRAPWEDPASRHILYATPAQLPIDGQPPEMNDNVETYVEWINSTALPKLFVHAEPGALMNAEVIAAAKDTMSNLTTTNIGAGIHFLAESKPDAVGTALSDWVDSLLK